MTEVSEHPSSNIYGLYSTICHFGQRSVLLLALVSRTFCGIVYINAESMQMILEERRLLVRLCVCGYVSSLFVCACAVMRVCLFVRVCVCVCACAMCVCICVRMYVYIRQSFP